MKTENINFRYNNYIIREERTLQPPLVDAKSYKLLLIITLWNYIEGGVHYEGLNYNTRDGERMFFTLIVIRIHQTRRSKYVTDEGFEETTAVPECPVIWQRRILYNYSTWQAIFTCNVEEIEGEFELSCFAFMRSGA